MECEPINNLDDEELKARYSKIQARICKIVNQPIKEPVEPEEKEKTGTGVEEADEDIETGRKEEKSKDDDEKSDDEGDNEKSEGEKSDDEGDQDEEKSDDEKSDDEKSDDEGNTDEEKSDDEKSDDDGAKDEEAEKTEEFTQNIMNSSSNAVNYFTNSDYNYIIGTSLFIFILFFIYLRYKNK